MRNATTKSRLFPHVLVVDVVSAEIAGNASKQNYVGLTNRLCKGVRLAHFYEIQSRIAHDSLSRSNRWSFIDKPSIALLMPAAQILM